MEHFIGRAFIIFSTFLLFNTVSGQEKWNHWPCVERIKQITQNDDYIWINGYSAITKIHKKYGITTQWGQDKGPLLNSGVGKLVMGTNNSVFCFNGAGGFFEYTNDEWIEKDIKNTYFPEGHGKYAVDNNSELWVADTALFHFDGSKWDVIAYPNIQDFSRILDFRLYNNVFYIVTKFGVYNYSKTQGFKRHVSFRSVANASNYVDMQFDLKGDSWMLFKREGLFKIENGNMKSVLSVPNEATNGFSCFLVESTNSFWFGTAQDRLIGDYQESGVYHFDGKSMNFISRESSDLELSDLVGIIKDENNVFWFAGIPIPASNTSLISKKGNVFKPINYSELPVISPNISHIGFLNNGFFTFSHSFGIPWVNSLSSKINNEWYHKQIERTPIAVANTENSILLKTTDSIKFYNKMCEFEYAIPNYQAYDEYNTLLTVDNKKRVWCDYRAAYSRYRWNLQYYENDNWHLMNDAENSLPNAYFFKIEYAVDGSMFVATDSALYSLCDNNFTLLSTYPSNFQPSYKMNFKIDIYGYFWFNGSDGDLFMFDGINWQYLENEIYPYSGFEYHLQTDSKGAAWLALSGRYLYKYYNNEWTEYTTPETPLNFASNGECLHIDSADNFWMGSNLGIFHLNENGVNLIKNQTSTGQNTTIYPNPFTNELVINHNAPGKEIQFKIFDYLGRLHFNSAITSIEESTIIQVESKPGD